MDADPPDGDGPPGPCLRASPTPPACSPGAGRSRLERMRNGEVEALDEAVQEWWNPVVDYVTGILDERDAAEDAAQRAFCQLWEHRTNLRPSGTLKGLLFRIAHNIAIGEYRHRRVHERSMHFLKYHAPIGVVRADDVEVAEVRQALIAAVATLPPRRRQVVVLRFVHELSYADIAAIMGTSLQTVANQLSRALTDLRRKLANLLD